MRIRFNSRQDHVNLPSDRRMRYLENVSVREAAFADACSGFNTAKWSSAKFECARIRRVFRNAGPSFMSKNGIDLLNCIVFTV
jgi:hypothetical protein